MANKKPTLKTLQKKADTWFSRFIRLRDTNKDGICHCITCKSPISPKYGDCGHFIKRQHLSLRYNEQNCAFQCKGCNGFEQGNDSVFAKEIDFKWEQGTAEKLQFLKAASKRTYFKHTHVTYGALIQEYKQKTEQLLKEKGILKWW